MSSSVNSKTYIVCSFPLRLFSRAIVPEMSTYFASSVQDLVMFNFPAIFPALSRDILQPTFLFEPFPARLRSAKACEFFDLLLCERFGFKPIEHFYAVG